MRRRRDGLIDLPGVARAFGRSLTHTRRIASNDPKFPPVERREGARKLYARCAVKSYRQCYRPPGGKE
jgi:hypothetical protein